MYNCYVHGWSSHHFQCPSCINYTTSGTTIEIKYSALDEAQAKIERLEKDLEIMMHENTEKTLYIESQKQQIERLEKENINLSDQCLDLEMQLLSVNQTLDAWKTEIESQEQIIDTLKGALKQMSRKWKNENT